MKFARISLLISALFFCQQISAQDSTTTTITISTKYLESISNEVSHLDQKLDQKSGKALKRFQKREEKIKAKLFKTDSSKAIALFSNSTEQYSSFKNRLQNHTLSKKYIPSLDTLATSLNFLQQTPKFLSNSKDAQKKLQDALNKVSGLQSKFQNAEEIKQFLKERRQYLKEQLQQLGFAKQRKKLNKQIYYYSEQLNEYKSLLKDHKKAERKAIALLSKTKLFKDFMRKNSQLASLFRLPGDPNDPSLQTGLSGLQTRLQVNSLIQQRLSEGGLAAHAQFQQSVQNAQGQLQQLKDKVTQLGRGSSEIEMPEGFKPNNQKTRSFLKRLEFGTNIQSQKARGFFPTTSDIGFSLGYKLNDKSILGIGASYKMGWGKDIRHIHISHQGIGIRSFVDWKVKGSFWISGGYEMNYRSEFNEIDVLKDLNAWQQSGLIGLSKTISMKTKFFKKTKLQLLWDFLSYQQVPKTQPIIFRVGYNFR